LAQAAGKFPFEDLSLVLGGNLQIQALFTGWANEDGKKVVLHQE